MNKNLISLIILLTIQSVQSWWDVGHMVIAQIAELHLQKNYPEVYQRANEYVHSMNGLDEPKNADFVTAAVWADDIKDKATDFLDNWHYFDRPVNPQGLYLIQDDINKNFNAMDVLERSQFEFNKQYDLAKNTTAKAIFIRYVLHTIGDVHQPLHATTLFNQTYNTTLGDLAGNFLKVEDLQGDMQNFHAMWDQGMEYFQTKNDDPVKRPLTKDGKEILVAWGEELIEKFPIESYEGQAENLDPSEWTRESWKIAKDFVYPFTYKTNKITKQYENQGQDIVKQRATLAGYRLANFLVDLLQKDLEFTAKSQESNNNYTQQNTQNQPQSGFAFRENQKFLQRHN